MDDDYQLLAAYPDYIQAELVRTRLAAAGIEAVVFDDQFHTMLPLVGLATGGVQVMVPARDYPRASSILEEDTEPDPPTCPGCGSTAIQRSAAGRRMAWLSTLLFGLPIGPTRERCTCEVCGHSWSA